MFRIYLTSTLNSPFLLMKLVRSVHTRHTKSTATTKQVTIEYNYSSRVAPSSTPADTTTDEHNHKDTLTKLNIELARGAPQLMSLVWKIIICFII